MNELLNDWTLLVVVVVLLGSIFALTALVTIISVRHRFKGNITVALASILGIFAGIGGASHGPGEILQGNIAPDGIIIEAWPALTSLAGEPAMTFIPSFSVSGIVTVITGFAVTIWAALRIQSKNGALVLILLSTMMLFVGGGLIPPALGVVAGIIIGARVRQKDLKKPPEWNGKQL
jgi:hypothetical protein